MSGYQKGYEQARGAAAYRSNQMAKGCLGFLGLCAIGVIGMFACCGGLASLDSGVPPRPEGQQPSKRAIAEGYQRGLNDLEGRTDSTDRAPIIAFAEREVEIYMGGDVQVLRPPFVRIVESGRSWTVEGRFTDGRVEDDFVCLVRREAAGLETVSLLIGDEVVKGRR